jgi:hypothetical protein
MVNELTSDGNQDLIKYAGFEPANSTGGNRRDAKR